MVHLLTRNGHNDGTVIKRIFVLLTSVSSLRASPAVEKHSLCFPEEERCHRTAVPTVSRAERPGLGHSPWECDRSCVAKSN